MNSISEEDSTIEVGRFIIAPNRKVYGFTIEAYVKHGTLEKITSVLAKHKVLTLSAHYNMTTETRKIRGLAFVDLTDADASIEEIAKEIREIDGVKHVQIINPSAEGFVVDTVFTYLMLGGERAIIVRRPGYKGFIDEIRKQFKSAGEAFLYYEGYNAGIEYGKAHQKLAEELGIRDPAQIIYKVVAPLFTSAGFGRLEVVRVNLNPPEATIRIYNNFECKEGLGAGKTYSQWVRGSLAGILTGIFNVEVKAIETKCIAKGDPYCEFEIIK